MNRVFRKWVSLIGATFTLLTVSPAWAWGDQNSIIDRLKQHFNHRCEFKQGNTRLTLASDGQARFLIVVPKNAPAPVRFAGQELKHYLDRITGADFNIASKRSAGLKAIILGDGPEARELGIDVDKTPRDGYSIIAKNNIIAIAGRDDPTAKSNILFDLTGEGASDPIRGADLKAPHWDFERGSLYGTYRFLEQLGIRWFFPGPKGEVVPSEKTLTIQSFTIRDEPSYALRYPWPISATRSYLKSRGRSGRINPQMEEYSDIGWTGRANYLWFLRMRGSSEWFAFNHRPPRHYWLERFNDTHPEYFAVKADGKRDILANAKSDRRHVGHLCYSEEGVFEETMKDIEAFFSGKTAQSRGIPKEKTTAFAFNRGWRPNASYGDTFSLLPHDGWRECFCDRCQAKIRKDLGEWGKLSGIIWPFVEKVARATEKRFPDKALICLAYSWYSVIPDNVKLPGNVIVGCSPRLLNKTYNCVDPERRKQLMALVTELDGANDTPLLYWFHHLFHWNRDHFGAPMLLPRFMNGFIRDLSKHGRMMFMQMDFDSVIQEHLNRYVFMRTLYDTSTDVNELIHDYTRRFYGPEAGPIIEAMINDIEKRSEKMAAAGPKDSWRGVSIDPIWTDFFPPKVVNDYREQVDRAFKIAGEEPYREHVRLFSEYFIGFMEKGLTRWKKSQTK